MFRAELIYHRNRNTCVTWNTIFQSVENLQIALPYLSETDTVTLLCARTWARMGREKATPVIMKAWKRYQTG